MKKWLSFILLLIVLSGTFVPCCLVDNCNEDEVATTHNDEEKKQEGSCSPFFACTTCPGFIDLSTPIQIILPDTHKQQHHEKLIVGNLTSYLASYWQPPRC